MSRIPILTNRSFLAAAAATLCVLIVAAPASAAEGTASTPAPSSAAVAADCSVPVEKRLEAAIDAALAAKDPGTTGSIEQSLQATFKYLHLCKDESISFAQDKGNDVTVGPKAAGEAVPFSADFSHVGTRSVSSSCQYVALLPKITGGTGFTGFLGWVKLKCPVVATFKSRTCLQFNPNGSWYDGNCDNDGDNNWTANKWWESLTTGSYGCVSTQDFRTSGNPSRFANGSWAGPGWIYSGVRDGNHFC